MTSDQTTLSVQEFARLAGVTVRALHVYDHAGLLAPSVRTAGGHRRYRRGDLVRLQQILTLKYLGFSLEEIANLLNAPAYDLRSSLAMQKNAIEQRILQLQGVVYALTRTLDDITAQNEIDWTQVVLTIRGLQEAGSREWLTRYYSTETQSWLQERAAMAPRDLLEEGTRAWQELYTHFGQVADLPAEHDEVQHLAAEMDRLIAMFTGGDQAVEHGLRQRFQNTPRLLETYGMQIDPAVQRLMQQALTIFRERRTQENKG